MIEYLKADPKIRGQRAAAINGSNDTKINGISYIKTEVISDGSWKLKVFFLENLEKSPLSIPRECINILNFRSEPAADLIVDSDPVSEGNHLEITLNYAPSLPRDDNSENGGTPLRNYPVYFLKIIKVPNIEPLFSSAPFYLREDFIQQTPTDPLLLKKREAPEQPATEIDYLSKDYAGFRHLILDHLNLLVPQWKERHAADPVMTIVEIMAYAGDYLSYHQDAAATEAYPGTARQRISLRRHTRLLDYFVNQGCNSRVLVQVQVNQRMDLKKGTPLLSSVPDQPPVITQKHYQDNILELDRRTTVFETMADAALYPQHNRMRLYMWEMTQLPLQNGVVTTALEGHFPYLKTGDPLYFNLVIPGNRKESWYHPVYLTKPPHLTTDPFNQKKITIITWAEEDALPYSLLKTGEESKIIPDITALGNILLADSGRTVTSDSFLTVQPNKTFYPHLKLNGLVYAQPYHPLDVPPLPSVKNILRQEPTHALPALELKEDPEKMAGEFNAPPARPETWTPERDLLNSGPFDQHFTVETQEDGGVYLRFGDGQYGKKPPAGARFKQKYRLCFSPGDNVSPFSIVHIVLDEKDYKEHSKIKQIFNPQAATGSKPAETKKWIRQAAPQAFKNQARCITAQDFTDRAETCPGVDKARAAIDYDGCPCTANLYIDRGEAWHLDEEFILELKNFMEPYRPMGFQLQVHPPNFVPLDIALDVYTYPGVLEEILLQQLYEAFSNRRNNDGTVGFFFPGNFTFGQPVYLSKILDRVMAIEGVRLVDVERFRRYYERNGVDEKPFPLYIEIGPLEIARLDNQNGAPGNGVIVFNIKRKLNFPGNPNE